MTVSRDITAQKKAEDEISSLNSLLEEKVRNRTKELLDKNILLAKYNLELATFNRIASHDLQEPLRKIQIFTKLILDSKNGIDESNEHFRGILRSTERMRNLIDATHKFSLSEQKKVIFENCDLNEVLNDVLENFDLVIEKEKVIIKIDNLPIIKASKILLTQVFINLIENAIKYSKKNVFSLINVSSNLLDSKKINLSANKSNSQFYAIVVEDNGIGFENKYKDQIFEAFKRLHSESDFQGTGIGLTLCKTIVEKHGGWIDAESTVGIGSSFTVYLPSN